MIRIQDIRDRAAEWQLRVDIVEKDYVLGWLLAATGSHPVAGQTWVFKGGTCLKKCYVETYRFSEDLDFSLLPESPYTERDLRQILQEVAQKAGEMSGIDFPQNRIEVRPRQDKQGNPTFEARIAYRGPLAIPSYPRVLFDITRNEPVLDTPSSRPVFHPYPDFLPDGTSVHTYSLNELLAEKTRALYERTRPRDLYDVVYTLENKPQAFELTRVQELFARKCKTKELKVPSLAELLDIIRRAEELRSEWENMLAHQLPVLPDLDSLLSRLPDLLRWIEQPAVVLPVLQLAHAPLGRGEMVFAPSGIQYWGGGAAIEAIRFAGANRLLLEFTYGDGGRRRVEPYSLRRAQTGNLLLYGWEEGSTHIKAFNTEKMVDVRATKIPFQPRYRIEFTSEGPITAPEATISRRTSLANSPAARPASTHKGLAYGPTYVFECPYCQKRFKHAENNPKLRKHKMKGSDWDCPGRQGYLMAIE